MTTNVNEDETSFAAQQCEARDAIASKTNAVRTRVDCLYLIIELYHARLAWSTAETTEIGIDFRVLI